MIRSPLARTVVAAGASLGAHAAVIAVVVLSQAVGRMSFPRVDTIEITTIPTEAPKDLPLGAPPPAGAAPRPKAGGKPKSPAPGGSVASTVHRDAGAGPETDAGTATKPEGREGGRKHDLRAVGPPGSRLTALVRLDRLRQGPHAATYARAMDDLLRYLPDRRNLLDGSGLDLYRDFDTLLIATPNPTDAAVTFLALRHHLREDALRAGIDRASVQAGRPLVWSETKGRPHAVRQPRPTPPGVPPVPERDDRLVLLPAPGLGVVAPPAYAKLLLDGRDFRVLARRLESEEDSMPPGAVFVMVAANLFGAKAPGGSGEELGLGGELPPFQTATLSAGTSPEPSLDVRLEFASEKAAAAWERRLPVMRTQLIGNPLVALGGFTALLSRVTIQRDETTVVVHTKATADEIVRLMRMLGNFTKRGAY